MKHSLQLKRTATGLIAGGALLAASAAAPVAAEPAIFAHTGHVAAAVQTDEELGEFSEFAGDDNVFDANDEGFLRENIDDDEAFEIGFDENNDGVLDDNEVLGEDVNNDEALTEDEFGVGVGAADEEAAGTADVTGVFGDDERFDANDEGFLRENIDEDEAFEIGFDEDESGTLEETEVLGEDVDNDEGLGAPVTDEGATTQDAAAGGVTDLFGDDQMLDENDEGFLRENVDEDEAFEVGIDEDASGTLDENEVLGEDVNEDEALTEDELLTEGNDDDDVEITPAADVPGGDFATFAGEDAVFDANDEGFVREDINNDGAYEIGYDEDASGTLDENEVLGQDLNEDEALTEDEFGL